MSDTLTIRLPAEEKARLRKRAAETGQTAAEFARAAIRERLAAGPPSPWDAHFGKVKCRLPDKLDNAAIRRAFRSRKP